MILIEYYPGYDIGYDATKMYVDVSSIRYITHTTVGGHKYLVIGFNGKSFTLTDESGNDLLCRMGLSKEDLIDEIPDDWMLEDNIIVKEVEE